MKKNLAKKILVNIIVIPFCFVLAFFSHFAIVVIVGEGLFLDSLYNCLGFKLVCNSIYDGSIGSDNQAAFFSLTLIITAIFAIYLLIYVKFLYPKIKL